MADSRKLIPRKINSANINSANINSANINSAKINSAKINPFKVGSLSFRRIQMPIVEFYTLYDDFFASSVRFDVKLIEVLLHLNQ